MGYQWGPWRDRYNSFFGGKKPVVGLAMGVFDFCHEGHVNFLRRAAENCDRLVVGVHTDARVREYKGVQPSNSGLERMASLQSLGFIWQVEVESDRVILCNKYNVDKIFHGDDWDRNTYANHFGEALLDELGVELVMLPHTPGISSTALRLEIPPIGWWLHSSIEDWSRIHIFDHMKGLFAELGGVWFLSGEGRNLAKTHFNDAPRFLLEEGLSTRDAAKQIGDHELEVLVTAHFNFDPIVEVLSQQQNPCDLVVISHGRSGKPGTSADVSSNRGQEMSSLASDGYSFTRGNMTIHDLSFSENSYGHFDSFLKLGGSFTNPVSVSSRPKILLLPTWNEDVDRAGLIMGKMWFSAFKELAKKFELVLSPHPLLKESIISRFVKETEAIVLPAEGKSFEAIPDASVVVADLSGVLWEALLFDTPVILGCKGEVKPWAVDLAPSWEDFVDVVPAVSPEELVGAVSNIEGKRQPLQRPLGEARLGHIDGHATKRLAQRVESLCKEKVLSS